MALGADVHGQPVRWSERRLVVCSLAPAARHAARLDQRLQQAGAAIERLNERQQGKPRLAADQWHMAADTILQRRAVPGLVRVHLRTTTWDMAKRTSGARPAQVVHASHRTIHAQGDATAGAAVTQRLGWRVYATHHPP